MSIERSETICINEYENWEAALIYMFQYKIVKSFEIKLKRRSTYFVRLSLKGNWVLTKFSQILNVKLLQHLAEFK